MPGSCQRWTRLGASATSAPRAHRRLNPDHQNTEWTPQPDAIVGQSRFAGRARGDGIEDLDGVQQNRDCAPSPPPSSPQLQGTFVPMGEGENPITSHTSSRQERGSTSSVCEKSRGYGGNTAACLTSR
jgi:hypothetical protein